jgi:hypothetical protein
VSGLLKREGGDQLPPEDYQQINTGLIHFWGTAEEGGTGPTTS